MGAQKIVFILGPARSGTSILYTSMRRVFGLKGSGEGHVIQIFNEALALVSTQSLRLRGNKGALARKVDFDKYRHITIDFLREFYRQEYGDHDWIDKTPGPKALSSVKLILEAFPTAKIIVTRRTGIEVVESFRKKFKQMSFEAACKIWAMTMTAILQIREQNLGPGVVLEMDQFDLANRAEDAATRIAMHIDGRPEKARALTACFTSDRSGRTSSHDWAKRLTLAEVTWSDKEKEVFTRTCGQAMTTLGYPV